MQVNKKQAYKLIGLMSGTSLDGLDICIVDFLKESGKWKFDLIKTQSVDFSKAMLAQLKVATQLSGLELSILDHELGAFFGKSVNAFLELNGIDKSSVDAIASHGQTIFHQPDRGLTVQIGCGQTLAQTTNLPVINDFRKKDVLHGGQGAPLVPIGDLHLFSQFADTFLNIGGFANLSQIVENQSVKAFDVCPANITINHYTRQLGEEYDRDGLIAQSSQVDQQLFDELNQLEHYVQIQPPSLAWEWVEKYVLPLVDSYKVSLEVKIATLTEHSAYQLSKRLNNLNSKNVFITGGGAKNKYLIKQLHHYFKGEIILPSTEIIDFKEALIFAFLGALFLNNESNCLPSVTGARIAVRGGVLHAPN